MSKKISEVITKRIKDANKKYHANSNISEFIKENEYQLLIEELTGKFDSVLDSLVIDRFNDPNSMETGHRLAKMYINEIMSGRYYPDPKVTAFPNNDGPYGEEAYTGMLVVRSELKSMCSHHHQPVTGIGFIGIIPADKVIGLSKYTRIAQHVARRGTLQEELCSNIAQHIMDASGSKDVAVHIGAQHGCCTNRGIMAANSTTQTTVLKGLFLLHTSVKQEFFDNIKMQLNGSYDC